jgi:aminopeptidase N
VKAIEKTLLDTNLDKAMIAAAISLPSEAYLAEFMESINPEAIYSVRRFVRQSIAKQLKPLLLDQYQSNLEDGEYSIDAESIGKRALKNTCLSYLMELEDEEVMALCVRQFKSAHNMTDVIAALSCLVNIDSKERESAINTFYEKWKDEALVVDKWFNLQAMSRLPDTLEKVKILTGHPAFTLKNPNKVRALIGAFCNANHVRFHNENGEGYCFLADHVIALDKINPQVAARMSNAFTQWRKYEKGRQRKMKSQIERILEQEGLSRDVYEVMSKSLAS